MRRIKSIIMLFITSFIAIGLVGCSEKILVVEDVKSKLQYDEKVSEMLLKSAEAFPSGSEKIFDEHIKALRSELESMFKNSKESSNLKLKDSIKKELKDMETAYKELLKYNHDIESFTKFLALECLTDEHKKVIKVLYEKSKSDIETASIEYIETVEEREKNESSVLNALTMVCEKDMVSYEELNKFYGLSENKQYKDVFNDRIPQYKSIVDAKYTLSNSDIKYLDVKSQSEKEPIWERAKEEIESKLKSSGKLTFPSSVMSQEVSMKKSGSIYIITSYVDVEKGASKERKEFIVKYDVSRDYYMLISAVV